MKGAMIRAAVALGCVLFLAQATGAFRLVAEDTCTRTCADDVADGGCVPSCVFCLCCAHAKPLAASPAVAAPRPTIIGAMSEHTPRVRPAPDPREILHVPKPVLA